MVSQPRRHRLDHRAPARPAGSVPRNTTPMKQRGEGLPPEPGQPRHDRRFGAGNPITRGSQRGALPGRERLRALVERDGAAAGAHRRGRHRHVAAIPGAYFRAATELWVAAAHNPGLREALEPSERRLGATIREVIAVGVRPDTERPARLSGAARHARHQHARCGCRRRVRRSHRPARALRRGLGRNAPRRAARLPTRAAFATLTPDLCAGHVGALPGGQGFLHIRDHVADPGDQSVRRSTTTD
jgi:hypothetical protein